MARTRRQSKTQTLSRGKRVMSEEPLLANSKKNAVSNPDGTIEDESDSSDEEIQLPEPSKLTGQKRDVNHLDKLESFLDDTESVSSTPSPAKRKTRKSTVPPTRKSARISEKFAKGNEAAPPVPPKAKAKSRKRKAATSPPRVKFELLQEEDDASTAPPCGKVPSVKLLKGERENGSRHQGEVADDSESGYVKLDHIKREIPSSDDEKDSGSQSFSNYQYCSAPQSPILTEPPYELSASIRNGEIPAPPCSDLIPYEGPSTSYDLEPMRGQALFGKEHGLLVKSALINNHYVAQMELPRITRNFKLLKAYNNTLTVHLRKATHCNSLLFKEGTRLREQVSSLTKISDMERARAEEAWKKADQTALFNRARELGAEQRFFLQNKYEAAVTDVKKSYETRFKEVEADRGKLARENEVLCRKIDKYEKKTKLLKRKIALAKKLAMAIYKSLEISYVGLDVASLMRNSVTDPEMSDLFIEILQGRWDVEEQVLAFTRALGSLRRHFEDDRLPEEDEDEEEVEDEDGEEKGEEEDIGKDEDLGKREIEKKCEDEDEDEEGSFVPVDDENDVGLYDISQSETTLTSPFNPAEDFQGIEITAGADIDVTGFVDKEDVISSQKDIKEDWIGFKVNAEVEEDGVISQMNSEEDLSVNDLVLEPKENGVLFKNEIQEKHVVVQDQVQSQSSSFDDGQQALVESLGLSLSEDENEDEMIEDPLGGEAEDVPQDTVEESGETVNVPQATAEKRVETVVPQASPQQLQGAFNSLNHELALSESEEEASIEWETSKLNDIATTFVDGVEYVTQWDSDSSEITTPPIVLLDNYKRTERTRARRHRNSDRRQKRAAAVERRTHSTRSRLLRDNEIVPVTRAQPCEKLKLESHLQAVKRKREEEKERKSNLDKKKANESVSKRAVEPKKNLKKTEADSSPITRKRTKEEKKSRDFKHKLPIKRTKYSMEDLFGDDETEKPSSSRGVDNGASSDSDSEDSIASSNSTVHDNMRKLYEDLEKNDMNSVGPASPEPEPEFDFNSIKSIREEADPVTVANLERLLELPLAELWRNPSLFSKLKQMNVSQLLPCIYIAIANTTPRQLNQRNIIETQISRCPLIPRFLNLLEVMMKLQATYSDLIQNFLDYLEEILADDTKRELERDDLLVNFGRFVGALCLTTDDPNQALKSIFAFGFYRGPHIYPFTYGVLCSNSNLFGFCFDDFENFRVEVRGVIITLARSVRWGDSRWAMTVVDFIEKSLQIGIPEYGFDEFFNRIVKEYKALESQKQIDVHCRVMCLLIAQRGWQWYKANIINEIHNWITEWKNGQISDGSLGCFLDKIVGAACCCMRRMDLPDDVQTVLKILETVTKIGDLPQLVSHAAKSAIEQISGLVLLPENTEPEIWHYDKKRTGNQRRQSDRNSSSQFNQSGQRGRNPKRQSGGRGGRNHPARSKTPPDTAQAKNWHGRGSWRGYRGSRAAANVARGRGRGHRGGRWS